MPFSEYKLASLSHEDCRAVLMIRYKPTDRAVDVLMSVPTFSVKCHCKDNIL